MEKFIDQLGREVILPTFPPQRIVSLVPSQTELLADLGLAKQVVGVTKFCVHPELWRKEKTIVGGTKKLRLKAIEDLAPDLIIVNQEENEREQVLQLARQFPVWASQVTDLVTAMDMIRSVGKLCAKAGKADQLTVEIMTRFAALTQFPLRRTLYLIWQNPYMGAGGDTFIHSMLKAAGFINVLEEQNRYPTISEEQIQELDPEVILLSSEPFPFREKHLAELSALCPNAELRLVDGEMFSWYGSRLLQSAAYFFNLRTHL